MKNLKSERAMMKELLDNKELLNGTIFTEDGGVFEVHMEFVVAMSSYLRRIMIAAKDTPIKYITIPGVSRKVIANIINFIYNGELELSMDIVSELAKAGQFLEMPYINKLCQKYLISNFSQENYLKIYTTANYLQIPGLKDEVLPYILGHFQQLFPVSSDYLNIDISNLLVILSSDNLHVTSEEDVFWAIMRWVEHDPVTRVGHLPDLLRCIRMGFCDPQFYEHNIQSHPCIKNNEECLPITLQASQVFADMPSSTDEQSFKILLDVTHPFLRPRTPVEIIFAIGGWSAGSATNDIETYDIKSGRWFLSLTTDSLPRAYHGMVWHEGYIYVIGGYDGFQCLSDVRRFDPVSHLWEEKGCMNTQRCYVSVVALGRYIYAMGGYNGEDRTMSCERYDPKFNQWKMVANMNEIRSDAGADTLNGKIYIAGGFNGDDILDTVECYIPETDTWTAITNMTSPRSGAKLTAYDDCLFIIGGFNGEVSLQTVEKYDPKEMTWTPVCNMNRSRSNFAATVLYDCLYVIGGFSGRTTIPLVECYDHRENVWSPITELTLNRSALGACTVKDIPNAIEYTFLGNAAAL